MIISVFTPHGGCPERCHFCDQSVSGGEPASARAVGEQIENFLRTSREGRAEEIAFYGGTFTAMPRARQLAYLEAAKPYLENGRIGATRISTRPDAVDRDWIGQLRGLYRLRTVELGVQSFNPDVLTRLGRTHSVGNARHAVAVLRGLDLRVSLHLMIGCPGDTGIEEGRTNDELALQNLSQLQPDFIRIHPLLVLKGTALENEWRSGAFKPLELEAAVDRAAALVDGISARLPRARIIRLGLQPNELLGEAVLAGPYHPAFGDLVRCRQARGRLAARVAALGPPAGAALEVLASEKAAGALKGQGNSNLEWIRQRFDLSSIRLVMVRAQASYESSFEVRFCDPSGVAQRRQIESPQQARR